MIKLRLLIKSNQYKLEGVVMSGIVGLEYLFFEENDTYFEEENLEKEMSKSLDEILLEVLEAESDN